MTDRAYFITLLESILPYVKDAERRGLPNAAFYAEILEGLIWEDAE